MGGSGLPLTQLAGLSESRRQPLQRAVIPRAAVSLWIAPARLLPHRQPAKGGVRGVEVGHGARGGVQQRQAGACT